MCWSSGFRRLAHRAECTHVGYYIFSFADGTYLCASVCVRGRLKVSVCINVWVRVLFVRYFIESAGSQKGWCI